MSARQVIIESPRFSDIVGAMKDLRIRHFHATNTSGIKSAEEVAQEIASGFQYIVDRGIPRGDAFVVATNTDASLWRNGKRDFEDQEVRLRKLFDAAVAVAQGRPVIGMYHGEPTPKELYDALADAFNFVTLFKWGGYGMGTDVGIIEGADRARRVHAHPFYDKSLRPMNWENTRTGDQSAIVRVIDLYQTIGSHGQPYRASTGELLFEKT